MTSIWENNINEFIMLANQHDVKMLMVGGAAVNFHGYQRHSADVDFWIDTRPENMEKLIKVFQKLNYDLDSFPNQVMNGEQNISVKFSPIDLNLELITRFSIGRSFDEAYEASEEGTLRDNHNVKWRVVSLEDLIDSKVRAGRNKDLLDIQELKKLNS